MKRARLPLLAVLPATVISLVVAVPFVAGDHPLRWESGSLVPHLVLHDQDATRPAGSGSTTTASNASPAAPKVAEVAQKWKKGMPQWGAQLYWEDNPAHSLEYVEKQARLHANYLVGLHANSVSISFPFVTKNRFADEVSRGTKTPTPDRLARVLQIFHEAGLRTTVRPLMDEKTLEPDNAWRGSIKPADRDAWFASYEKFLTPYLKAADGEKAATFVIATELNSLQGDPHWDSLVDDAEKLFTGEVSYDANWDAYVSGPVTMPVRHLGIDAYFPVKVGDDASVQTLVDGWDNWLDRKATGPLPKITIAEAGIGAMNGAYHAPGDFYTKRAVNPKVQANWYTAVCQVVQERHMSGVYWWSIYFDDDPNTKPDDQKASRLDFAGRPQSEKAIKACFTSDYAGPGPDTAS
ncbi:MULTISPECIES: glycoside hydrolase family 113 [Streptomyces]|uniref:Glycoside hydrolase family 5 domain-containing protein n=2 Tax=Streptomyces TaxID=1883 RepID=A0ABV9IYP1_9ACTN